MDTELKLDTSQSNIKGDPLQAQINRIKQRNIYPQWKCFMFWKLPNIYRCCFLP